MSDQRSHGIKLRLRYYGALLAIAAFAYWWFASRRERWGWIQHFKKDWLQTKWGVWLWDLGTRDTTVFLGLLLLYCLFWSVVRKFRKSIKGYPGYVIDVVFYYLIAVYLLYYSVLLIIYAVLL